MMSWQGVIDQLGICVKAAEFMGETESLIVFVTAQEALRSALEHERATSNRDV